MQMVGEERVFSAHEKSEAICETVLRNQIGMVTIGLVGFVCGMLLGFCVCHGLCFSKKRLCILCRLVK